MYHMVLVINETILLKNSVDNQDTVQKHMAVSHQKQKTITSHGKRTRLSS